jgi:hypothetical protein
MRPPASESENRTHGAKKMGPGQYLDFFNRIGPKRTFHSARQIYAIGSKADQPPTDLDDE